MKTKLLNWLKGNQQLLIDGYIFLNFLGYSLWKAWDYYNTDGLDYLEISFITQNLLLTSVFLFRRTQKAVNKRIGDQAIAVIAFFSGIFMIGHQQTTDQSLITASTVIVMTANVLGIATLLNLGRSFGILIAYRGLKQSGLYSIVRHPMYFTDILLRIGYLVSHFNLYTVTLLTLSAACYIYRALLEERFLSQQPEYAAYMQKVKYRFIPYVF